MVLAFFLPLLFLGCETLEDPEPFGTASLQEPEVESDFLQNWLENNELMAYVMENDDAIYVDDAYVDDIKESLEATVDNGVWLYQNSKGDSLKRNQQPLNIKDYANRVAIVKWSFARGYQCQELPKGYKLPIHRAGDRNRKIVAAYELTEKGSWCVDNRRYRCKFGWKKVTARFIKVNRNGKLRKKNGEYIRYPEASMNLMVCTND
nr:hypothetical protein [Allomuricauda sp.]